VQSIAPVCTQRQRDPASIDLAQALRPPRPGFGPAANARWAPARSIAEKRRGQDEASRGHFSQTDLTTDHTDQHG
jgi:hypothetical protein